MHRALLSAQENQRLKRERNRPTDDINRHEIHPPKGSLMEITGIHICHESPEIPAATDCCPSEEKSKETAASYLSTLATTTFYLCLFTIRISHPFDNFKHQYDQSLLLPLFAVFNFVLFVVTTFIMMLVRVSFSRMQKCALLMSVFTLFLVPSNSNILAFMYLAMILFLWAGWIWSVKIKPSKGYRPI